MKTIISCSLTFVCTPHWSNSQHSLLVCKPCMSTMTSRPRSYFNRANLKQQDMWKTRGQLLSLVHLISQRWSPIEVNKRQPDIQPGVSCFKSNNDCTTRLNIFLPEFALTELPKPIPETFPPRLAWETPTPESRGTGGGGCSAGTGPPKTRWS